MVKQICISMLQIINTHEQGLHNSITANEKMRSKAKLETRKGRKKGTVGVAPKLNAEGKEKEQNHVELINKKNPRKKHPTTSRAPMLRPQMKDKHLEDKNKKGLAAKRRKEWVPLGVGGASAAGRTT